MPKGDTGEKGEVGPRGEQGIQGNPGPINSIKIGRVEKGEEASVTIVGSTTSNFYEKNKSRTHEGKLKKWTMILGGTFIVLTIALGIVYVI